MLSRYNRETNKFEEEKVILPKHHSMPINFLLTKIDGDKDVTLTFFYST